MMLSAAKGGQNRTVPSLITSLVHQKSLTSQLLPPTSTESMAPTKHTMFLFNKGERGPLVCLMRQTWDEVMRLSSLTWCLQVWSVQFCTVQQVEVVFAAENVKNKYNKTKQNKKQKHKTKERPAGSGAERATTFWRNKHLESHWTLCWSGSIYRWEESSEFTFWPLGLKLGLIFAPVYQPDCSNNLMTLNVVSYLTSLSRMSGVGPLNETWVNLWISLGLNTVWNIWEHNSTKSVTNLTICICLHE